MNYGDILTRTWKTLWQNKIIFGFGMLMIVAPAMLGIFMGLVFSFTSWVEIEHFLATTSFEGIGSVLFFLAYFLFILLTILFSGLSFAGTFKGVLLTKDANKKLSFGELWDASMPYLWQMLGIMFSIGFALMVVYMVPLILLVLFGAVTAGIGFL